MSETQEQIEARRKYHREYSKRRRAEDPEYAQQRRDAKARYRATKKGKETAATYRKQYDHRPHVRERIRNASFKKAHGMDRDEADQLIVEQGGLCAICAQPPCGKGHCSRLHIDHCHTTGKIRGALCSNCNQALGKFNDSRDLLLRAMEYLDQ